jgi:proline iminopeptidase
MSNENFFYPTIEPYDVSELRVSDLHTIVYEQVGNPDGRPALFLHGGPGVGISPGYRQFFDPEHYRIVLVHQRGAGESKPHAEIAENDTWHIVSDLETLRDDLGIKDWVVMGGSWGSLLALCYAITHPASVAALIIRGIFLGRQSEIDWIHSPDGAAQIYPDEWERYNERVSESTDKVAAYCKLLNCDDAEIAMSAARSWTRWEASMMNLFPDQDALQEMIDDQSALSIARIESHFTKHNFFLEDDNFVLDNCEMIAQTPCHIVQGRYDIICPPISAWQLHHALPSSTLTIVPNGAHSPMDAGMARQLVDASNQCRSL